MFLQAIGKSQRRQRAAINVIFLFVFIALLLVGLFTIKRNTYHYIDKWALAEQISKNATQKALDENQAANFTEILWGADLELVYSDLVESGQNPDKDILLVVNTIIGVDDDVHDKRRWYVVIFTFVGTLVYGWNALRFVLWIDRKLEAFLDNSEIYENLGDENEFTDFVLDLRNQRMQRRPVEIKSVRFFVGICKYWKFRYDL
uniref:Uncharacterized protein n=2 Tax=Caenorhabditis japonica TaxID=281687 RepID=A0A8R1DPZ7_CAEJA